MIGVTAMCGLAGYFIMHKAKQAGLDSGLLSKNPFYAAAKMAATMNPDVETVIDRRQQRHHHGARQENRQDHDAQVRSR